MPAAEAITECRRQVAAARPGGPVVLAYEPYWAIGAPAPAPEEHIREVCAALRAEGTGRVVYGGSAGPGLLTRLGDTVDGLFLGRFAHDPSALAAVLAETRARTPERTSS